MTHQTEPSAPIASSAILHALHAQHRRANWLAYTLIVLAAVALYVVLGHAGNCRASVELPGSVAGCAR